MNELLFRFVHTKINFLRTEIVACISLVWNGNNLVN